MKGFGIRETEGPWIDDREQLVGFDRSCIECQEFVSMPSHLGQSVTVHYTGDRITKIIAQLMTMVLTTQMVHVSCVLLVIWKQFPGCMCWVFVAEL